MTQDHLWLVDPCASEPYFLAGLGHRPMGGTEATVLRVLSGLAEKGVRSRLFQRADTGSRVSNDPLFYTSLQEAYRAADPSTVIVVINAWKVAIKLRKSHPAARILLWLHNYPGRHNRKMGAALVHAGVEVVCVSHSHATHLRRFLGNAVTGAPKIHVIYNPVSDALKRDATRRDPDLLLFASAPHKGLAEIFERFVAVRQAMPSLSLHVADPGYMTWTTPTPPEGVAMLGPLPQSELHCIMRQALCLFYPQSIFAETFGLVIAEANALGTPVICQRGLGANDEIVSTDDQTLECSDISALVARLTLWRRDPPRIKTQDAFRIEAVVDAWFELLQQPAGVTVAPPEPATTALAS
ncbi:glycosyltransferase family 4 protein [Roseobacter litoralis]|uniref:glycosyltransferase family 4 protein n=1 Tax=Roseobacter litoralis TaxID=42443 RepID=UPI0024903FDC|nr:glycosyltransferase family 4 protein [Roseobacter litoralis]